MTGLCRREESGFTLVEILVAMAILMIGLLAVMQWFPLATAGVDTGRRQSTAVFLGEQRIEQIKAWSLSTGAGQGFATVVQGGACCANDAFGAIPGYPEYSRTVTISPGPTPTTLLVRVVVEHGQRRLTATTSDRQVDIATLIASH